MAIPSNAALTMINLANISYSKEREIGDKVKAYNSSLEVILGPNEYIPDNAIFSVSLAYIVKGPILTTSDDEYTVVIRGTNLLSWTSWSSEDFNVGTTVPFSDFVSSAPIGAAISGGTATGLGDLGRLTSGGQGILDFLGSLSDIDCLNLTGHSLGGTLVPPFYMMMCEAAFGGPPPSTVQGQPFSFAGLTAGNAAFNDFLGNYIPSTVTWRYVNPLDIAPNLWWSLSNVEHIYDPYKNHVGEPRFDGLEKIFIEKWFGEAAPFGYEQPADGAFTLAAQFDKDGGDMFWVSQALHQHHGSTYITLLGG